MYTIYHLSSAQDVSPDILEAIKTTFKSKAITITVEEEDEQLTEEEETILDERLKEDEATYLTAEQSVNQLKEKYGV